MKVWQPETMRHQRSIWGREASITPFVTKSNFGRRDFTKNIYIRVTILSKETNVTNDFIHSVIVKNS